MLGRAREKLIMGMGIGKKSIAEGKASAQLIRASDQSALCNRGVAQGPRLLLARQQLPELYAMCGDTSDAVTCPLLRYTSKNPAQTIEELGYPSVGTPRLSTQRKSNLQSSTLFCTKYMWKGWEVPGSAWSRLLLHSLQHQPRDFRFISIGPSWFHYILL